MDARPPAARAANTGETPPDAAADLAVLGELRSLVLREGYLDAMVSLGLTDLWPRDPQPLLAGLPAGLATLLELLALGGAVDRAALEAIMDGGQIAALRRLGILLERDGRIDTSGLLLVPLSGTLLFVPRPEAGAPYLGDDTVALAERLLVVPGARCLDLFSGPGALAVVLAVRGASVVAVEDDEVGVACAELNAALNQVGDRVEIRRGTLVDAVPPAERLDLITAVPPVIPFAGPLSDDGDPAERVAVDERDDAGAAPLWQVLDALPALAAPGGRLQLVATGLGDGDGPRVREALARHAEAHRQQIVMTVSSRVRMRPGDRLFDLVAATTAGGLAPEENRRLLVRHLGARRVDSLFRYFLTVQPDGPRPGLHVARLW